MPNKTKFVFVIPAFNCVEDIDKTVFSVIAQSYDDWEMIVLDDLSTDNTGDRVEEISSALKLQDKITVIKNKEKHGEVRNTLKAAKLTNDDDVIVRLDAGDWLTENDTLYILDQVYSEYDPAVVWTAHRWAYTSQNISGPLPDDANVYQHPWVSSHLKTFRKSAINGINENNFKDANGNYIMIACDQAVFLPILHKAFLDEKKRIFIPVCCYHYNIDLNNPKLFTCDRSLDQKESGKFIRNRGFIH